MALPDAISEATEPGGVGRTMTCLFIGGTANGQRICVPDGMHYFRVSSGNFGTEYRAEQLASPSRRYTVFVENHLTLDEAMRLLLDYYRPQTDFANLPEK